MSRTLLLRCALVVLTLGLLVASPAAPVSAQEFAAMALAQAKQGDLKGALAAAARIDGDVERTGVLAQIHDAASGGLSAAGANQAGQSASGAPGGGTQADFDTLIELITTTIAPTSWDDVGGSGSINPFPTGVLVDANGLLRATPLASDEAKLAKIRASASLPRETAAGDLTAASDLRKVSLPRLEKQLQLLRAAGQMPTADMLALAGLECVSYVFVYPETGDLVLAGPAGAWQTDSLGHPVSIRTGRPVLRLDDLVVMLRHFNRQRDATFGCAITPTEQGLAAAKQWVESPARQALARRPSVMFAAVRQRLGRQKVEVFGLDSTCRAARVLVEADYHMKLVGLGLAPSIEGLPNYLEMIDPTQGDAVPALDVLRWWFTLDRGSVATSADRVAFAFEGRLVRLQSENEMLTDRGKRIHTGQANPLNDAFAKRFTESFSQLAEKYPIYADLENVFSLALVAALVERECLAEQCNWHLTGLGNDEWYRPPTSRAPLAVESMANHRVVLDQRARQRHTIGAVSGGVWIDVASWFESHPSDARKQAELDDAHAKNHPTDDQVAGERWWWD